MLKLYTWYSDRWLFERKKKDETQRDWFTVIGTHLGQGCSSLGWALSPVCSGCRFDSPLQQGIFLPAIFQCRLFLWHLYSPHVQSHAWTSVFIIKMPCVGSYTVIWTQENTACTRSTLEDKMWPPQVAGAICVPKNVCTTSIKRGMQKKKGHFLEILFFMFKFSSPRPKITSPLVEAFFSMFGGRGGSLSFLLKFFLGKSWLFSFRRVCWIGTRHWPGWWSYWRRWEMQMTQCSNYCCTRLTV